MSDPNVVRVLRMNELSSTRYEDVPLPVRQQLGDFDELVDVDARSGNGLRDYDLRVDERGADYQGLDPEHNGHRVLGVSYHLDTTDAPAQGAADGPGSQTYQRHQAHARNLKNLHDVFDQTEDGVHLSTQGNATLATQTDEEYINTQREVTGRNQRYAEATGMEDHSGASVVAGAGGAAFVIPSQHIQHNDGSPSEDSGDSVPRGTISSVLSWVGDDAEKARQAREVETQRETPRNTLLERLDNIIEDDSKE